MSDNKNNETTVQEVDLDINEINALLDIGTGSDTVMLADEKKETKRGIFSDITPDTTFLDKAEDSATDKPKEELVTNTNDDDVKSKETSEPVTKAEVQDALAPPADEYEEDDSDKKNKGGRPTAMVTAAKKLIDKGLLKPFQDENGNDEPIENYTAEDFEELIEANFSAERETLKNQLPSEFMQTLPPEMQQAYEYISKGGTDLKGMFGALAASNEIRDLDVNTENDQKQIIRTYLQATRYGTPEEIEDELYSLEDRGDLVKKAKQFKPKLDAMQQQLVNERVARQEQENKKRQNQSQKYIDSVYTALETGNLNGLDLDNKTQNMLYSGLVQSNYPSVSGKQTNMLGHLLEKYQWVEPRHDLIAEALWLLADPDGYKSNIKTNVEQETNEKVLRTLKTEQATKSVSTAREDNSRNTGAKKRGVQRPRKNFFGR
mgnify:CR=1 FL=1|tara:strand:+ start:4162 stop:5460 length:1299 start_codon:yes stop_codon:yes gene_type:complete